MGVMATQRTASSWAEVVALYAGLAQEEAPRMRPMLQLVEFLAGSRYARSLLPHVSREGLVIVRAPGSDAGDGELHIRFDAAEQAFVFTHVQRPDEPNPWRRECAPDQWRPVLERLFHKRLQWFHEG
jgi:hypothetical protein